MSTFVSSYEQWSYGDQPLAFDPGTEANPKHVRETLIYDDGDKYFERGSYLLFVHGWNMRPFDKDSFSATAYKRLWWNGFKGRFGALRWPTDNNFTTWYDPLLQPQHYDKSEFIAWQTGERLAKWLPTLAQRNQSPVDLMGHSMGNVVVSNALYYLDPAKSSSIGTYIATQAAVPGQLYSPNFGQRFWAPVWFNLSTLSYESWNTPNVYSSGIFEWIKLGVKTVNFLNPNDYALGQQRSGLNQLFKPDIGRGGYLNGPDEIEAEEGEFEDRFYRSGSGGSLEILLWNNRIRPEVIDEMTQINQNSVPVSTQQGSRYHIMSYLSESRSYPLGASPQILLSGAAGEDTRLNNQNIWPMFGSKEYADDPTVGAYSGHRWHSAQFRMSMGEQKEYWKKAMRVYGYDAANNLP